MLKKSSKKIELTRDRRQTSIKDYLDHRAEKQMQRDERESKVGKKDIDQYQGGERERGSEGTNAEKTERERQDGEGCEVKQPAGASSTI